MLSRRRSCAPCALRSVIQTRVLFGNAKQGDTFKSCQLARVADADNGSHVLNINEKLKSTKR